MTDSRRQEGSVGEEERIGDGIAIKLRVDGSDHRLSVDPRTTLLDALRERLGITSPKKGCDHGQCGACTLLLDGRSVNSCLALAVAHDGSELTTAAGLAGGQDLHPMQRTFIEHDAFQCGYCTPGQIVSAVALIREGNATTDEDIAEFMSGNICRCATYPNIRAAIREVRDDAIEDGNASA